MKILVFLFAISLPFTPQGQSVDYIHKADSIISSSNGNLRKASKYLRKAKKADYGFCANASMDAYYAINTLKSKIWFLDGKFEKALKNLGNYCYLDPDCDLLRLDLLCKLYGKKTIINDINKTLNQKIKDSYKEIISIELKSINYTFTFLNPFFYIPDRDYIGCSRKLDYLSKDDIAIKDILPYTLFYSLISSKSDL